VTPDGPRDPDRASFASADVAGRRGRAPLIVLAGVAVLASIVGVGVGGRSASPPTGEPRAAVASASVPSPLATGAAPVPTPAVPTGLDAARPLVTSGPGPIQLQARRTAASVFVHGDVFVPRVTWVYLSLRTEAGDVASWASVSVPGAVGPGQASGPTLRFDVDLALPESFVGSLFIYANAYDADGKLTSSTRMDAGAAGSGNATEP